MLSRPTYRELCFDPTGRSHLIAGVGIAREPINRVEADAQSAAAQYKILYHPDATETLAGPLFAFLSEARMGLRVYLTGPECFLWEAMKTAAPFGFGDGEIQLQLTGAPSRDVFCVHCRHVNRYVASPFHHCAGCGIKIAVREHFSRRLGCYMGVSI